MRNYKYVSNGDGTCTIFCTNKDIKEAKIPEKSPKGETVTVIGEEAFS